MNPEIRAELQAAEDWANAPEQKESIIASVVRAWFSSCHEREGKGGNAQAIWQGMHYYLMPALGRAKVELKPDYTEEI